MGRIKYRELAKGQIKEKRNIVISEVVNGASEIVGYSISEQLVVDENGKETKVFLKDGIGIVSETGLVNFYKALKDALHEAGIFVEENE